MEYIVTLQKIYHGKSERVNTIWSVKVSDHETALGMIAATHYIFRELNNQTESYIVVHNVPINNIAIANVSQEETSILSNIVPEHHYGIWLKSSRRFMYDLHLFTTSDFLRGLISMAETFKVDFRDIILNLPFDSFGRTYTLQDYHLNFIQESYDVPNDDDIDVDEDDDENIHDPYRNMEDKTDAPPDF